MHKYGVNVMLREKSLNKIFKEEFFYSQETNDDESGGAQEQPPIFYFFALLCLLTSSNLHFTPAWIQSQSPYCVSKK